MYFIINIQPVSPETTLQKYEIFLNWQFIFFRGVELRA